LHIVSYWAGHPEIVRLLLDRGARVDMKDDKGRTPLQVERVGSTITQILAERDASVDREL